MRVLVVGAGAWGLPAAAELARRGHRVTLIDRYGPANRLSSSTGPTRLWRLTHPDGVRVRLALRSVEAMRRLERLTGTTVHLTRGLLWRDDAAGVDAVGAALGGEGVRHEVVAPGDVGRFLPGLVPDGRPAVHVEEAGPVLAEVSLRAQLRLLAQHDGTVETARVVHVERGSGAGGVRLHLADGTTRDGDVAVLAPGPGAEPLLRDLGVALRLRPRLEQVVHLGDTGDPGATDGHGCLVDRPRLLDDGSETPNLYAMPTPGRGYKIGIDEPIRDLVDGDDDRTPDESTTARVVERVRHGITGVRPQALDAQVCCWTESPDGRFVIDNLPGGVVIACGDSGEGFKFSALMGLLLADLAEGRAPDAEVASFSLARFAGAQSSPASAAFGESEESSASSASGAPASSR